MASIAMSNRRALVDASALAEGIGTDRRSAPAPGVDWNVRTPGNHVAAADDGEAGAPEPRLDLPGRQR